MKTFNYMAKDSSGALKRGSLAAADRSAALAEIRLRGLLPVSVCEGQAASSDAFPQMTVKKIVVALASLAVIVVVGVLFLMLGKKPSAASHAPPVRSEPSVRPVAVRLPSPAVASPEVSAPEPAAAVPPQAQPAKENSPVAEVPSTSVAKSPQIGQALQTVTTSQPKPSGYSSGTEAVINMIVNARLGTPPPPLLRLPQTENIAEILDSDIIVYDDDSEKSAAGKANVAYAKQLLKEYIQAGGTPENFLQHYHARLTSAFEEWRAAQKYTRDLLNAGDKDGAARYVEEQNKKFAEKGVRPIIMPLRKK